MNINKKDGNLKLKLILLSVILLILIVVILSIISKNNAKNTAVSENESREYFTMYSLDDKVGVIDKSGNVIIDPEYTEIYIPNSGKDVFICFDDEKYTILNKKKNELFKNFDDISVLMISENSIDMEKNVLAYKENNLYGLVDLSGNKLTDAIYESVESLKNKPGNILVKKDGLYGVLNYDGKEIIESKYNSIKSDEYCSEKDGYKNTGYIISEKTKNGIIYGYVNPKGETLITPKYESVTRAVESQDDDIYLIVMENGKKGVIKNKKQIIKNKYQSINYYDNSDIFIVNKNGKYGFFNNDGKEIIKTEYTSYSIAGNYIFVKKDDKSSLYDIHGNLINNSNYKSILETENPSYFIAQDDKGYYSIISKDITIDEKYTNISYAFDNFFIFTDSNGKTGLLNVYTGIEIQPEYDSILLISNAKALEARKENNLVDIYSENIEKVVSMENGIVETISDNFFVIYSDTEMKYLNNHGEIVKNVEVYPNLKIYSTEKDGKWGFADKNENIVVEPKYDIVTEVNEYGFAGVCKDGKWGVIDENGKTIIEPTYEIETYYSPKFIGKYLLEENESLTCVEIED